MNRLKEIRKKRNLTLKQVGKMVGVSEPTISNYETGKREPDFDILCRLADVLEVSTDYLLEMTDDPTPKDLKQEDEKVWIIRERLRRDPSYRLLFDAADNATPEHLRAAAAMLKALEPPEEDAD